MPRRRPVPRNAGAVAALALLGAAVTGCGSGDVPVRSPAGLTPAERTSCSRLLDALPRQLDGLEQRSVDPPDALGAAWGEDPVVLRCGVPEPQEFDDLSTCQVVNDVAWFIPESQITGAPVDVRMTTIGRSPGIEVSLPATHFPPAAVMAQLADPVKRTTRQVRSCGRPG